MHKARRAQIPPQYDANEVQNGLKQTPGKTQKTMRRNAAQNFSKTSTRAGGTLNAASAQKLRDTTRHI
ncbi:MAG: hypothetical protein DBX55_07865 [Verrucomicrobia bacterium]|nr:MAG: hypothetical protein DBX55_07865 [Verrucomicrobiota bacterium]